MPDLETTETQSSLEFNFVIGKLKHSITRQRRSDNSDIILKEKVEFAKRLLSKGFQEAEVIELAFTFAVRFRVNNYHLNC